MPLQNSYGLELGALDFDVDTTGQIQPHQGVDRLIGWLENVDEPIMGAKLEVLHRLLVDVRSTNDAETSDVRGKRNWAANSGACSLCCIGDLFSGLVNDPVIVCSKSNSYFHLCLDISLAARCWQLAG